MSVCFYGIFNFLEYLIRADLTSPSLFRFPCDPVFLFARAIVLINQKILESAIGAATPGIGKSEKGNSGNPQGDGHVHGAGIGSNDNL